MMISQATVWDIPAIMALHRKYHIDSIVTEDRDDGFVTTNFTIEQLQDIINKENGITIAKQNDRVVAYAMAASWQFWSQWPFMNHMIQELPKHSLEGTVLNMDNSYQYGPVCIDSSMRGKGVFEKIFSASYRNMAERFPYMVTFINQVNHRSYAAHTKKALMKTMGTFPYNKNDYYILGYEAKLCQNNN